VVAGSTDLDLAKLNSMTSRARLDDMPSLAVEILAGKTRGPGGHRSLTPIKLSLANVRVGSEPAMASAIDSVRFMPESGHDWGGTPLAQSNYGALPRF
jgi:hypothetical protein